MKKPLKKKEGKKVKSWRVWYVVEEHHSEDFETKKAAQKFAKELEEECDPECINIQAVL